MLRTLPTEIQISQLTKENEELIREINRLSLEEQLIKSSQTSNLSLQSRPNHEGGLDLRFQNKNTVEDNYYKSPGKYLYHSYCIQIVLFYII